MTVKKSPSEREIQTGTCLCDHPMVLMGRISQHLKEGRYPKRLCPALKEDGQPCGCSNAVMKKEKGPRKAEGASAKTPEPAPSKPPVTPLPEFGPKTHKGFQVGFKAAADGEAHTSCLYLSESRQARMWRSEWEKGFKAGLLWLAEQKPPSTQS